MDFTMPFNHARECVWPAAIQETQVVDSERLPIVGSLVQATHKISLKYHIPDAASLSGSLGHYHDDPGVVS